MATGGVLGNGCKAAYSLNSPLSWTAVTQLIDLSFPSWVADRVNKDTHSTTNKLHRNMPGMITVGDPGFTTLGDMDPATSPDWDQIRQWNIDGTKVWWRFEVPTNRAKTLFRGLEFEASVAEIVPAVPIADKQTSATKLMFEGDDVYWDAAAGASEIS